jgi:secreted PhoX family phosphatase
MFVSIRGARPKAFTPLRPQDEDELTATLSTRERAKGWSKKTQVMEGFTFTIKAQTGKEDLPVACQWKPLVTSPSESPRNVTRPDQLE